MHNTTKIRPLLGPITSGEIFGTYVFKYLQGDALAREEGGVSNWGSEDQGTKRDERCKGGDQGNKANVPSGRRHAPRSHL